MFKKPRPRVINYLTEVLIQLEIARQQRDSETIPEAYKIRNDDGTVNIHESHRNYARLKVEHAKFEAEAKL